MSPVTIGKPYRNGTTGYGHYTREEFLQLIIDEKFKVQPPDWWLAAKLEEDGRSIATSSAIWYRNYSPARKYVIWDQAPEVDFRARGYLW